MKIIEEVFKNTDVGIKAIDSVLDHLDNENFRTDLNTQRETLLKFKNRAAEQLDEDAKKRSQINILEKSMLKSSIALKAMSDKSGECVAQMMIEGTNMGINSLQKEMNRMNSNGEQIPEIVTELNTFYQNNINQMRNYL